MIVEIKMFAGARQLADCDPCRVEVPESATIADLRRALTEAVPALAGLAAHVRFAIDAEYAEETTIIEEGAEIALIPPVSGG